MIKNLKIDENLEKYIRQNSYDLHPVQKNIIEYNNSLGNQKKMQISVTQSYFFQFLIKTNNIKNIFFILFHPLYLEFANLNSDHYQ